jgi:hypothetical protein
MTRTIRRALVEVRASKKLESRPTVMTSQGAWKPLWYDISPLALYSYPCSYKPLTPESVTAIQPHPDSTPNYAPYPSSIKPSTPCTCPVALTESYDVYENSYCSASSYDSTEQTCKIGLTSQSLRV